MNFYSKIFPVFILSILLIACNALTSFAQFGACITIGKTGEEYGYSVIQTRDGGYAAVGRNGWPSGDKFFLAKLDSNGTLEWSKTVGPADTNTVAEPYSIIQTLDGGFAITGTISVWDTSIGRYGDMDVYVVKLDSTGNLEWAKGIGSGATPSDHEEGYSII